MKDTKRMSYEARTLLLNGISDTDTRMTPVARIREVSNSKSIC